MRKLLIVDDNDAGRMTLSLIFRERFAVETAACGADAIAKATAAFDAALIDLNLPDGDGREVLKALKRVNPATFCIIMTGSSGEDAAGADGFYLKPIPIPEVMARLDSLK